MKWACANNSAGGLAAGSGSGLDSHALCATPAAPDNQTCILDHHIGASSVS
jgi:hypothetical protein